MTAPGALLETLEKCGDDKTAAAGLDFALHQIEALLAEGGDGISALNRLEPIRAVEPLVRGKEGAKAEART